MRVTARALLGVVLMLPVAAQAAPLLVELFTSTNCPNCPSAEAKWDKLAAARPQDVLVVMEHPDYWNNGAAKPDPWSSAEVTSRQYDYSNFLADRAGLVWTPQPVLDGQKALKPALFQDLDDEVNAVRAHMDKVEMAVDKKGDDWAVALPKGAGFVSVMALEASAEHPTLWNVKGLVSKEGKGKVTLGKAERPAGSRWLVVAQKEAGRPVLGWALVQ